ncbi:MAG: DUF4145 domain-containing protein, partial [Candidatus Caenarcaniphilales bacterium]|nr:DUF4145 domain-containing protein [Candidatus Caenarcaniphilales bacterium]
MPFNRGNLENLICIETHNFPEIVCPTCKKGILKFDETNLKSQETAKSKQVEKDEDHSPENNQYIFSMLLICDSPACGEPVMCVGDEYRRYEHDDESLEEVLRTILNPKFFYPTIELFKLDESIPEKLRVKLLESFSCFFVDSFSCANKLRQTLEILLDEFKVPKCKKLHTRIDSKLRKANNGLTPHADKLLSIIFIGNAGSHSGNIPVKREDIIDAYEIF